MKPRLIVTIILLAFVAVSAAYLVMTEATGGRAGTAQEQTTATGADATTGREVIAYYFHGNWRCATCRKIEAYTAEAIKTGFPKALADGRLAWRIINIDEPGNEHFVEEFEIATRTVVLAEVVNGQRKRWTNLQRVWDLIGDKNAFVTYIQDETRAYLEGGE